MPQFIQAAGQFAISADRLEGADDGRAETMFPGRFARLPFQRETSCGEATDEAGDAVQAILRIPGAVDDDILAKRRYGFLRRGQLSGMVGEPPENRSQDEQVKKQNDHQSGPPQGLPVQSGEALAERIDLFGQHMEHRNFPP